MLRDRRDFYALAMAYFARAHADNVVHAELFFDPQTHTARGVAMEVVIGGLRDAMDDARAALRHHVGADPVLPAPPVRGRRARDARRGAAVPPTSSSASASTPASAATRRASSSACSRKARALGLRAVAHAGEEGPAAYIREALDLLHVERIDHGVRCDEDPALVDRLVARRRSR